MSNATDEGTQSPTIEAKNTTSPLDLDEDTELCISEMQAADMCVTEAGEACEPCIEGVFQETYPLDLEVHLEGMLATAGGSGDVCTEKEESMCRYVSMFFSTAMS